MDSRETSAALLRKAQGILDATGWPGLFTQRFGDCALTGSARYDLMVWPDIDIHMPVDPGYRIEWAAMLADLNVDWTFSRQKLIPAPKPSCDYTPIPAITRPRRRVGRGGWRRGRPFGRAESR